MKSGIFTQDSIREIAIGFQKSRVLLTAYELGVFTALGNKAKSAQDVAGNLKADARSTERLMNALCALGLLRKKRKNFLNTSSSSRFLVKSSPHFMSGLMHVANMWHAWDTLTQAVRDGKPVLAKRVDKRGKEWLDAFIAAMHERACQQAKKIVSLLDLSGVSKVLDIGGASGAYSMAFVEAKKGIRAMVFDLPAVTPIARNYIRQGGFTDRIKTVSGDYTKNKLPGGFDIVFLSAVIHSNPYAGVPVLIRKCAESLNPGGQVVVHDFIMDEQRIKPDIGALFSLNMLVATESGDTYSASEVRLWMKEAGLSGIVKKDTGFGTALVIGRKD